MEFGLRCCKGPSGTVTWTPALRVAATDIRGDGMAGAKGAAGVTPGRCDAAGCVAEARPRVDSADIRGNGVAAAANARRRHCQGRHGCAEGVGEAVPGRCIYRMMLCHDETAAGLRSTVLHHICKPLHL